MTVTKVRRKLNRVLIFALAVMLGISSPLSAMAKEAVKTSNYVISKVDSARTELEKLAKSRSITGAIYLKDAYIVKSEADQYSEDVISIASGQSVSILSVDVDAGRNIWYKISYKYSGTTVKGYVEREFLVSSDSRFLEWEDKYITTTNREAIRDTSDCSDIEAFPENYRDALYALRKAHPNWRFVKQDVNLDWNTVINEEASGERSLISGSADSSYKEKESTGTSGWYVATKGIISYYMDPRNFLEEETIFMFEQETYNADVHTSNAVSKVLNGTFMSGGIPDTTASYADTFVKIGSKLNMSPIALASRVKQEQGIQGTSPLISGKYAGFEGYYNYFNVRANGATKELIYKNGLTYAKNAGWNTRTKSLEGGASIVANQYVNRGQDTLYLQKFDVDKSDGTLYSHQYMQNIVAPYSEAKSTYKAYSNIGLLDNTFVFKIPVYNNMPKGRCTKPNAKDVVSLNVSSIENLPVDQNAVLISLINGGQNNDVPMTYESSNKKVATVDDNGVVTGIAPGSVTISAKRAENTTNTASCKVNVIKADIAISKVEIPAISITYNPDVTLGSVELPDGFVWIDKTIIPTVENEGYSVTYSPDNSKYNALTLTIPVEVAKAAISEDSVKMPEDLTIDAGAELSAVTLPDGFVWKDNTVTAPKKTGTVSFDAIYCTDTANYETLTVQVNVKVVCKTHEYGAWEGTPADCENDGKQTRKCTICGAGESLEEKAFGHSYESAVTKEPTTKEPGERTYTCSKCHGSYAEEIEKLVDKHQHKYTEEITVKPGCLTTGTKTFTCSCGDSYTESIDAVGHTYNDKNECTVCDYVLPVVPVHIHSYTLSNDTATCTEDGEKVYSCGCGDSYTETSKKTGHSMKNGVCSICGYGKNEPTPTVAPTKTVEPTPTVAPTKKVEPTPTVAPTKKVEPTPTVAPTKKVEPTPTVAPTKKVEPTPTVAPTKKVEPTQAVEPTKKVEPTPTVAPTKKVEPTPKAKPTKKVEPTKGAEPTPTKAQASSGTDNNGSSSAQTSTDNASQTDNNQSTGTVDNKTETQPTGTTETKNDNQSTGTVENKTGNKSTASGETKKESQPADASETNDDQPISIVMMSTTILNKEKIEEYISTDNRCLEITMANDVVWNIDLTEVEDLSQIDMNLAVSFDDAQIPEETVADKAGENGYRLVDLKYDGEFEFPVTLKIPVEEKYVGKVANLFYYNPDTGELEYVAESLITDECLAIYRMKHASAYVMIYSDISMDPKIVAAIENIENAAEEEVETGGILAFADAVDVVGFADNKNIYYGGIAGIAVLVMGIVVGLIIYLRKDDLYYDDEDE